MVRRAAELPAPRLSSEAQALNEPENLGMAPAARLVVVDVERASEPGVYKVRCGNLGEKLAR